MIDLQSKARFPALRNQRKKRKAYKATQGLKLGLKPCVAYTSLELSACRITWQRYLICTVQETFEDTLVCVGLRRIVSDCCFTAPCTNIVTYLLTYLLTYTSRALRRAGNQALGRPPAKTCI